MYVKKKTFDRPSIFILYSRSETYEHVLHKYLSRTFICICSCVSYPAEHYTALGMLDGVHVQKSNYKDG
jgi:hypothetical protein